MGLPICTHVDDDFVNELQEIAQEHQWDDIPIDLCSQFLEVHAVCRSVVGMVLQVFPSRILLLGVDFRGRHVGLFRGSVI